MKTVIKQTINRFWSVRTLTLLMVWIFMLDMSLYPYRSSAMALQLKDAACVLPHLQNDFYFDKIMLLSAACFFSNVPFMNQDEMYVVLRTGKTKWGYRNIGYICVCGLLLSAILTILSILIALPAINFSNEWGSLFQSFAVNRQGGLMINQQAMSEYTPYLLQFHIFLIDTLAFILIGMILYTVSLFLPRIWAYAMIVVMVFLPSFIGKAGIGKDIFSPFSWIETIHWRFGYDNDKPDLIYIYTAYLFLIFLLAVMSQIRLRGSDWMDRESNK